MSKGRWKDQESWLKKLQEIQGLGGLSNWKAVISSEIKGTKSSTEVDLKGKRISCVPWDIRISSLCLKGAFVFGSLVSREEGW